MNKLVTLLSKHARNGVVSTQNLKVTNLRLLKLLQSNQEILAKELQAGGIKVLNDLLPLYTADSLKLYLRYHFGKEVNVSTLLSTHRPAYTSIQAYGQVKDVISKWGFRVVYNHQMSDDMIAKELAEAAAPDRVISKLPRKTYNALLYRAKRRGMGVAELVQALGYTYLPYPSVDLKVLVQLKNSQISFRKIGEHMGISKSAAQKYYKKIEG